MKINIYYGGRGIIDDPSLYVVSKITDVLKELNVKTEQINLFEQKSKIPSLTNTLNDADGIVLASTVEWYGIGGYMTQFLDSCWLYGDKTEISKLYMMPVVMSTTYGERDGMMNLASAWEILGGIPCDGICGYIADTTSFENKSDYNIIIEKKVENLYRTINQRIPGLPASNLIVKNMVSISKSVDLTPQESEQLSRYASDELFVQKQKEDLQELTDIFRNRMNKNDMADLPQQYCKMFQKHFLPVDGVNGKFVITVTDIMDSEAIYIEINGQKCNCEIRKLSDINNCDVNMQVNKADLDEIIMGHMTFQRAFMSGNLKMKGEFKLLRNMDQLFPFMESKQ